MDVWDALYSKKYVARATQQQTCVIFKNKKRDPVSGAEARRIFKHWEIVVATTVVGEGRDDAVCLQGWNCPD